MFGLTATYQDITRGRGSVPGLANTSGLDRYRITTLIENAVLDHKTTRHLEINTIVAPAKGRQVETTSNTFFASEKMDGPMGRLSDLEILKQDVRTLIELDEGRAQFERIARHITQVECVVECAPTIEGLKGPAVFG